ncbi:MAG: hypothetical protein ACJAQ0_001400, partial [Dasania sp.]
MTLKSKMQGFGNRAKDKARSAKHAAIGFGIHIKRGKVESDAYKEKKAGKTYSNQGTLEQHIKGIKDAIKSNISEGRINPSSPLIKKIAKYDHRILEQVLESKEAEQVTEPEKAIIRLALGISKSFRKEISKLNNKAQKLNLQAEKSHHQTPRALRTAAIENLQNKLNIVGTELEKVANKPNDLQSLKTPGMVHRLLEKDTILLNPGKSTMTEKAAQKQHDARLQNDLTYTNANNQFNDIVDDKGELKSIV